MPKKATVARPVVGNVNELESVVELRFGDLFDGPSDLIVLPCSSTGTITPFVAARLAQYSIPKPKFGMSLGETDIVPFTGAENIASFVAFAASVNQNHSTAEAIESIGVSLGKITQEISSIRNISAPLLGAGAGGLRSEIVVEAMSRGFRRTAEKEARLVIHILEQRVLDQLKVGGVSAKVTTTAPISPKRVFISYSGTSDSHKEWVAELGKFLRQNGIDARLDQWHLRNGMDLPQWMTNELVQAQRVVIISDSRYRDRADGRNGGVGWETMLIQGDMMQLPQDSRKYLLVVREDDFKGGVPTYLRTKFSIHWHVGANEQMLREQLLNEIYDVDLAPPLGTSPSLYVSA
ncbi:MAG: hypothetical protein JWP89_3749 [Schlesneria sp.]|nr:hypothetical protein [Schlesneria sp.]